MKLATFNLFQFVAPAYYWHGRDERNTYTPAEWEQKQHWIINRLHEMNADIVGFQEVFSIPELQTLCHTAGYEHFITVDQSITKSHDPAVYQQSVVALASRFPIVATHPIEITETIRQELSLPTRFRFSRTPICVDIAVPLFGTLSVLVVHLKSKRPVSLDTRYDTEVD